jgi:hypothetical protein
MHDDKSASDYNLEGGSTLHLVSIRLFLCHCDACVRCSRTREQRRKVGLSRNQGIYFRVHCFEKGTMLSLQQRVSVLAQYF